MFGKRGKYEAVPTAAEVKYKQKSAKSNLLSAYFTSLLCLILCATMFMSTSMAWFTSEVSNSGNEIYVGLLDVQLLHEDNGTWYDVEEDGHRILDEDLRWEPNHTNIERLKVVNTGDLAFNYRLSMSIAFPAEFDGNKIALAELAAQYISVYVTEVKDTYSKPVDFAAIESGWTKVGTLAEVFAGKYVFGGSMTKVVEVVNGTLVPKKSEVEYAIALHMDELAPGDIMGAVLKDINFKLVAAQLAAEEDAFGSTYDMADVWDGSADTSWYNDSETEFVIKSAEQLAGLSKLVSEGKTFLNKTVKLGFNIDLANKAWTPIGRMINTGGVGENSTFKGDFDGQGYTIYNLNVDTVDAIAGDDTNKGAGLFGAVNGDIKNVNVVNATIKTAHWAGVIVGSIEGSISNCSVKNATVHCLPEQIGADWDNGDKAGAIVGYATSGTIQNCVAEDVIVTAYRDLGAIAGASYNNVVDCAVSNAKLIKDDTHDYKGNEDNATVNAYVGRILGGATVDVVGQVAVNPGTKTYDANSTESLQDALNALNYGDTLVFAAGNYDVTGTHTIPDGVTVMGKDGETVVFRQLNAGQDDIFNCVGDAVIKNITFESNRKGYAIAGSTKEHDTDGDITVIDCKFVGIATEKNYGVYKNLHGDLIIKNCTFDNYNNAICGVNNGSGSTTVITGCTFTNIAGEAIGYVASTVPQNFESDVIANNHGLTADNVVGY